MISADNKFTQKINDLSVKPRHRGAIFQVEADEKGMVLLEAKESSLKIYLLIHPETDLIHEAKFFTYGGPAYTALADVFCDLIQEITLEEATLVDLSEIEQLLRDDKDVPALPMDSSILTLVQPIQKILSKNYEEKKQNTLNLIKLKEERAISSEFKPKSEADAEWVDMSKDLKMKKINKALDDHVRHGLQMDGGDITVLDLENETRVLIEYHGACGSCGAATGGTLFYIEDQLRKHVFHALSVHPQGL